MQAFNRGNFSTGHLSDSPNKKLVFKDKPNNMGLFWELWKNIMLTKGILH